MVAILLLLMVVASMLTEGRFLQPENLTNVLRQVSFEGLIAFGMTLVIVTGGIDLSVGSLVALTGVAAALVMETAGAASPSIRIAAGLGTGMAVGFASGASVGAIISRFSIPPFIVTLAAMLVARGFAFILCDGQPVYELPLALMWWGRGFLFEPIVGRLIPTPVVVMLGGYVVFLVLYHRTVFGRRVIAIGSNEEAAFLAAIPVRTTKLMVYALIGTLCGIAGVLHDAKLMAGDPKVAEMWELNVIAAVVVGGTSLFGGRGSITGTLIGILIIGTLNNSLNLLHVEHFWQKVLLGGVILAAALLDAALRRIEER
jgi:ribose/xylose/arabinose/galactoside ABC-type transport system permease subunit